MVWASPQTKMSLQKRRWIDAKTTCSIFESSENQSSQAHALTLEVRDAVLLTLMSRRQKAESSGTSQRAAGTIECLLPAERRSKSCVSCCCCCCVGDQFAGSLHLLQTVLHKFINYLRGGILDPQLSSIFLLLDLGWDPTKVSFQLFFMCALSTQMGKIHVYSAGFLTKSVLVAMRGVPFAFTFHPSNLALHRQWQRALQALKIWPGTVQVTGRLTALPLSSQRLLGSENVATNSANSIKC